MAAGFFDCMFRAVSSYQQLCHHDMPTGLMEALKYAKATDT
jgi:hypothetical protein